MAEWLLVLGVLGAIFGGLAVFFFWVGNWEGSWGVADMDRGQLGFAIAGLVVCVLLTVSLIGAGRTAWAFLLVPAALLGGWLLERCAINRREAEHHRRLEVRMREILARDPTALFAYERLAEMLNRDGRLDEALGVLLEWWWRDRDNTSVQHRIERLQRRMGVDLPEVDEQTRT